MDCPACAHQLTEKKQSDLTVDLCDRSCGRIWFDNLELQKVDEAHESAGEPLLHVQAPNPRAIHRGGKRACPRCKNVKILPHFFSMRKEVEVDTCGGCGGVWLDTHELAAIRKEFATEADRKKAFETFFEKMFKNEPAAVKAEREERFGRIQNIARAFRFILPSYYIPGKQPWGAF